MLMARTKLLYEAFRQKGTTRILPVFVCQGLHAELVIPGGDGSPTHPTDRGNLQTM